MEAHTSPGFVRRWSRGPAGSPERALLLVLAFYALLLAVVRRTWLGEAPPTLLVVGSWLGVGLAVIALVAGVVRCGVMHGDAEWSRCAEAMRGTSWRQRRAMIRALREGLPVAAGMRGPALAYTSMRGSAERGLWVVASTALMQAALTGRGDEGGLDVMRIALVGFCAAGVTIAVLNAARWRRIGATFSVQH